MDKITSKQIMEAIITHYNLPPRTASKLLADFVGDLVEERAKACLNDILRPHMKEQKQ